MNRTKIARYALLTAAATAFSIGLYVVVQADDHLKAQRAKWQDAVTANSYACGYLAGQRSIMRQFKMPESSLPADTASCPQWREIARQNGFTQQ